jgi:hypothetical protein
LPINKWAERINIAQYTENPVDDSTDEGHARFLQVRDSVVSELKKLRAWMPLEDIRKLDREDPRRGEALVIQYLVKDVAEANSVADFDRHMEYIYHWADEHRVWLSG